MDPLQPLTEGGRADGRQARRRYTTAFKRGVVDRTLAPQASVAAIALEYGLNANMVHKWRREFLKASAAPAASAALLPVELPAATPHETAAPADGLIEIACGRLRLRLTGRVEPDTLRTVLNSLGLA